YDDPQSVIVTNRPTGSVPSGQKRRAAATFTIITGSPPRASCGVNRRPLRSGTRRAGKSPGDAVTTSADNVSVEVVPSGTIPVAGVPVIGSAPVMPAAVTPGSAVTRSSTRPKKRACAAASG